MIGDVQCPLCGAPINVYKITQRDGMDGVHHEWRFRCFHCGIVNADYPADNFYVRKCFETKDDAIAEWNQNIKSFTKQAQIIPLKAQEPKKVKCVRRLTKVMKGVCPAFEMEIESVIYGRLTKFCKFCSQAVKWDG